MNVVMGSGVGGREMLSRKWIGQATCEKSKTKFSYSGYKSKCACVASMSTHENLWRISSQMSFDYVMFLWWYQKVQK